MTSLTAGGDNSFLNGITKLNAGASKVNTGANHLKKESMILAQVQDS